MEQTGMHAAHKLQVDKNDQTLSVFLSPNMAQPATKLTPGRERCSFTCGMGAITNSPSWRSL